MSWAGRKKSVAVHGDSRRLYWLDALRALSSLMVMFGHYYSQVADLPLRDYFDPGGFGVAVFFFISGYVVPRSVRPNQDAAAFRFGWSRLFRLYPLYWLSLLLGALAFHTNLLTILINTTMIQRFVGVENVIGVYWTLQIELIFYGIITLTILARRFNQLWLIASLAIGFAVLAVLLGYMRFHFHVRTPIAVPIGLAVIFTGNIRSIVDTGQATARVFYAVALCVASLLVVSFFLGYSWSWGFDENPQRFVISYVAASVVFFGFYMLRDRPFAIMSALGVISYPVYLIHLPVLDLVMRWLVGVDQRVVLAVATVAVIALSWLLHVAVEKPCVQLGRALLPLNRPVLWWRLQPLAPTRFGDH